MVTGARYAAAHERIYAAPDVGAVLKALGEAGVDDGQHFACRTREDYEIVAYALSRLKHLAEDDIAAATDLILYRALPLLDVAAPTDADIEVAHCREYIVEWIAGFPAVERVSLEEQVLDYLVQQLATTPINSGAGVESSAQPASACWTIGLLGRRRDDVVTALWDVVGRNHDREGDAALSALADLALPRADHKRILDEVHTRIRSRHAQPPSPALYHVMRTLADPSSIDVVAELWLTTGEEEGRFLQSLAIGVLGAIADMADQLDPNLDIANASSRGSVIDRAWRAVLSGERRVAQNLRPVVALSGDFVPNIDSPEVITVLLRELASAEAKGEDDRTLHGRYLLASRLSECSRPRQLAGWLQLTQEDREAVLARLREDAERDSGSSGPYQTLAGMAKEQAWQVALRLVAPEVFGWAWPAFSDESSPYKRRGLLELLAAFRMADIPDSVLSLIGETRDLRSNEPGVQAQLGAIRLAASSATPSSFAALLDCGLRIGDSWLLDACECLASTAVDRARLGDGDAEAQIWQRLLSDAPDPDRTAAAFTLEELAGHELLTTNALRVQEIVGPLLQDEGRSSYQRALLVATLNEALGREERPLSADMEALLAVLASADRDLLGWMALRTLAQFDRLVAHHDDLLRERLGLQLTASRWDVGPISDEEALRRANDPQGGQPLAALAQLYRLNPDAFAPALAHSLRQPHARHLTPLLDVLVDVHGSARARPLPVVVAEALLEQVERVRSAYFSPPELLAAAAQLIPGEFTRAPLVEWARDWRTHMRVALADALGSVDRLTEEERWRAVEHLLALAGDGQYAVRRAAYRGLGRATPRVLAGACTLWQASADADWRRRAAEASGWLAHDASVNADEHARLYQALRTDPERIVREDAERARREWRTRAWANELSQRLLEPREWAAWGNDIVMSLWRTGEAFVRLCNDASLREVREYLRQAMPRHARSWLTRLYEEGQKAWKEVTEKWPEPWGELGVSYSVGTGEWDLGDGPEASRFTYISARSADPDAAETMQLGVLVLDEDPPHEHVARGWLRGGNVRLSGGLPRRAHVVRHGPIARVELFELEPGDIGDAMH